MKIYLKDTLYLKKYLKKFKKFRLLLIDKPAPYLNPAMS